MPGFIYGPIQLIDVVTRSYDQAAIYNGADYIYTQHTLTGMATVHPRLVTDALQSGSYASGVDAVAGMALAFLQPRQDLSFDVGIVPFEAMAYTDDVQSGPEPISFNAVQVIGAKTVIVSFSIRWYTISAGDQGAPPLTSNRWVMSHQYDETFKLTIVTRGIATFRRDALLLYGTSADDYRKWLMIPIPKGYHRILGPIEMAQDGLSISYTVTDTRVPSEAVSKDLVHLAMTTVVNTSSAGLADTARDLIAGASAAAAAKATLLALGGGGGDAFGVQSAAKTAGALALQGIAATGALLVGVYDRLPRTTIEVTIVGFGTPSAAADIIYSACLEVMKAKFIPQAVTSPFITTTMAGSSLTAIIDHDKRTCTLVWKYVLPPSPTHGVAEITGGAASEFSVEVVNFLVNEELSDKNGERVYGDSISLNITKGPGQDAPEDKADWFGYIGTDITEVLVAQALQPAAPDGQTVNPPQAPSVYGTPKILEPQGRTV
jgi:hypothetical protein